MRSDRSARRAIQRSTAKHKSVSSGSKRRKRGHTDVKHAMDGTGVLAEGGGVHEEGRHEVNAASTGYIRVLGELGLPALSRGSLAERAGVAGESGGKRLAIPLELVGVSSVGFDIVAKSASIVRRSAWEHPMINYQSCIC